MQRSGRAFPRVESALAPIWRSLSANMGAFLCVKSRRRTRWTKPDWLWAAGGANLVGRDPRQIPEDSKRRFAWP